MVERNIDHFRDDAGDEEWISQVGKRGWYVLTHDKRIRYKPNEKEEVRNFAWAYLLSLGKHPSLSWRRILF